MSELISSLTFDDSVSVVKDLQRSRRISSDGCLTRSSEWWSRSDSNRRPPPCKGGALPAELLPRLRHSSLVGLGGFEPPASRLSGVRSNQLSYRPLQRTSKGSSKTGSRWPTGRPRCGHRHPATDSVRKEVIQPQVLLRLPCYDFTPIADHTFDSCSPEGLAHWLLVQPTFVM